MEMVEKEVPKNPEARAGDAGFGDKVTRMEGKRYPAGSLALTQVETALFAAEKGAITEPIEAGQAFYVAKLEDKTTGTAKAFDDQEVQRRIYLTLRAEQRGSCARRSWPSCCRRR